MIASLSSSFLPSLIDARAVSPALHPQPSLSDRGICAWTLVFSLSLSVSLSVLLLRSLSSLLLLILCSPSCVYTQTRLSLSLFPFFAFTLGDYSSSLASLLSLSSLSRASFSSYSAATTAASASLASLDPASASCCVLAPFVPHFVYSMSNESLAPGVGA